MNLSVSASPRRLYSVITLPARHRAGERRPSLGTLERVGMNDSEYMRRVRGMEGRLYRIAQSMLWREADAMDAVQEAVFHGWMKKDRLKYAESFYIQYRNADHYAGKPLIEKYGEHRYLVANPPQRPLSMQEMDDIYELPYMNSYHPSCVLPNKRAKLS